MVCESQSWSTLENEGEMANLESNIDRLASTVDKFAVAIKESTLTPPPLTELQQSVEWHARIGWIAISAATAVLTFLVIYLLTTVPRASEIEAAVNKGLQPINEKISAINVSLATLTADVEFLKLDASKNLGKVMTQSLKQTGDSELKLKTIAALATKAQSQGITTDRESLANATNALLAVKDRSADFWNASVALLNYRSFNSLPDQAERLSQPNIPNCTDKAPHPFTVTGVGPIGNVTQIASAFYEDCRFTIDSERDDERINATIKNGLPVIEFRHCLIVYSGGPFTLITWIRFNNAKFNSLQGHGSGGSFNYNGPTLNFSNCLFNFSTVKQVPPKGQQVVEALLAQNGPDLRLPIAD